MSNKKAHTLTELLIASTLVILLIASVLGSFVFANSIYKTSVIRENLQRNAFVAMGKIIKGGYETSNPSTGVIRLAEAKFCGFTLHYPPALGETVTIPNSTIYFSTLADPEPSTNPYHRWFILDSTKTSIIYHHPTSSVPMDEVIYAAPAGATITLNFWTPSFPSAYYTSYYDKTAPGNMFYGMDLSVYDNICIGIDVVISQNVRGKNITGCASTLVNVRNHAT